MPIVKYYTAQVCLAQGIAVSHLTFEYRKIASSNISCIEAHFRLLMNGIFGPFVMWQKVAFLLVTCMRIRDHMVLYKAVKGQTFHWTLHCTEKIRVKSKRITLKSLMSWQLSFNYTQDIFFLSKGPESD